MSADLLRRAAKLLRERAEGAEAGPWGAGNGDQVVTDLDQKSPGCMSYRFKVADCDVQEWDDEETDVSPEDNARYIALMHPPVALALAELFEHSVRMVEMVLAARGQVDVSYLVTLARAILREPAEVTR